MGESRFKRVGWFDDHQSTPSKKPLEPRTVAGRDTITAFPSADPTYVLAILAIEAEAAAEARAAALDEAFDVVDKIVLWDARATTMGEAAESVRTRALAAIDALREVEDK